MEWLYHDVIIKKFQQPITYLIYPQTYFFKSGLTINRYSPYLHDNKITADTYLFWRNKYH